MKYKIIFIVSMLLTTATSITAQDTGSFTDARDGKIYKTITIGKQTWMAENLAYKMPGACWPYDNNETHTKTYGYLYDWENAKKAAPAGWHLPSEDEWNKLTKFLGGNFDGGEKLKAKNTGGTGRSNGTDESGFNGLPAGRYAGGKFEGIGNYWVWWTSSSSGKLLAHSRSMEFSQYWVGEQLLLKENGHSVRCIKD